MTNSLSEVAFEVSYSLNHSSAMKFEKNTVNGAQLLSPFQAVQYLPFELIIGLSFNGA